jgi:hypothetical protein
MAMAVRFSFNFKNYRTYSMKILVIHKNRTLLAHLADILSAAGHDVATAISVNESHENLYLSALEPGERSYSSFHYSSKALDLVLCAPYDPILYCGEESHLRHILNGMAEYGQAACGILSSRKGDEEKFRLAGFTSFVSAKDLRSLTLANVNEVLNKLVKGARESIRLYDCRGDVYRRRAHQKTQNEIARQENALLQAALSVPANQRSMNQYYLVEAHHQEQSRLRCM